MAEPSVSMEVHPRATWSDALLAELYALAITMSAEDRGHFLKHAYTNDTLHLFRAQDAHVVGFQFWRSDWAPNRNDRLIVGGKLRIAPRYRRCALHLRSGLAYYREQLCTHAETGMYRVSIASLFGFVAITRPLASYQFVSEGTLEPAQRWLCDVVDTLARDSDYAFDRSSGRVQVGIKMTESQLSGYPASFFQSAHARAYAERNPAYATNGSYLAFWFPLSTENLSGIERAIALR